MLCPYMQGYVHDGALYSEPHIAGEMHRLPIKQLGSSHATFG
jgi:hypothetical protein